MRKFAGMRFDGIILFVSLSLLGIRQSSGQCLSAFPYFEDFESGPAGWVSGGVNSDWSWGAPSKFRINSAGSGSSCWITGGLSSPTYNGGQKSWVQSPCFDFTNNANPYVSFLIFWDTERQYDGGNLQYSLNGGTTWTNAGNTAVVTDCKNQNWFNTISINNLSGLASPQNGWSGSVVPTSGSCLGGGGSGQWVTASLCLGFLAGRPDVTFRFTFASGTTCNNYDGLAIDSFVVSELNPPVVDFDILCDSADVVRFQAFGGDCPRGVSWDFGDPASGNNSSNLLQPSHQFSKAGIYTITLQFDEPCFGAVIKRRTLNIPKATAEIIPVRCVGNKDGAICVEMQGVVNPVFNWTVNPSSDSSCITALDTGIYVLEVSADSTCAGPFSWFVGYDPEARPRPAMPGQLLFCEGDELIIDPGPFSSYSWQDGSTDSVFVVRDTGWVSVVVSDDKGCVGSDSTYVRRNCFTGLYVPSAFTPGDDLLNEVFRPVSEKLEGFEFKVFNRLGQQIFMTRNQLEGWDGRFRGEKCASGVYVWKVRYRAPSDKERVIYGRVSLLY